MLGSDPGHRGKGGHTGAEGPSLGPNPVYMCSAPPKNIFLPPPMSGAENKEMKGGCLHTDPLYLSTMEKGQDI